MPFEGPPPKLATLHWPTGPERWGTFYCLMHKDDVDACITLAESDLGARNLRIFIDDGNYYCRFTMYMLPPRPFYGSSTEHSLYLVCFVDERWKWHQTRPAVIDTGGVVASWADSASADSLVAGIGRAFGWTANVYGDTQPSAYLTPDADRWYHVGGRQDGITFAEFHSAILTAIQSRLVFNYGWGESFEVPVNVLPTATEHYSPTSGRPGYVKRPDVARTDADAEWTTWGGHVRSGGQTSLAHLSYACPSKVWVMFGGAAAYAKSTEVTYASLGITASGFDPELYRNSEHVYIEADLNATASSGDRSAWATQAAKDWYNWQLAGRIDATFNGVIPWKPTGGESAIEWSATFDGDRLDFTTRVIPHPHAGGQILRGNDASHLTLVKPIADATSDYGFADGTVVKWNPANTSTGKAAHGDGTFSVQDDVSVSVPGEYPVPGHVYLAVRQPRHQVNAGGEYQRHYVGAPRGNAMVQIGTRLGGSGTAYYNGTAFIKDGTNLRNVGACYVRVRGFQHQLLINGSYHEAEESGLYTDSGTEKRLFTVDQTYNTGSVYEGGLLADGVTAEALAGTTEGLPGHITTKDFSISSFSITPDSPGSYSFTATISGDVVETHWKLGVSPQNFVNGLSKVEVSTTPFTSTATFTVPAPP